MNEDRIDDLVSIAAKAQAGEREALRRIERLQREVALLQRQKRETRRLLERAAAIVETGDSMLMRNIIRTIIEAMAV